MKRMKAPVANTAHVRVMARLKQRGLWQMDKSLFEQITLYRTTMAMVKKMLDAGLISAEEYAEIDTIIAKKYGLNSSTIYR